MPKFYQNQCASNFAAKKFKKVCAEKIFERKDSLLSFLQFFGLSEPFCFGQMAENPVVNAVVINRLYYDIKSF